ncbi:FH1/FH2 domain-containing protein 3-like [Bolinopsis microptera]|uniref:FH1/FH2 domain-containing protein 3-like n=1 Tax=Bolinopsis microptera TaxID=2820187 RepID=UPI00307A35DE
MPDRTKKNRRQSAVTDHGSNLQNINAHAANIRNQEAELGVSEEEEVMIAPMIVENGGGDNNWSKQAQIMDSNMVPPPPPQKTDAARIAMIQERREKAEKRLRRRRTILNIKSDDDKKHRDDRIGRQFEEVVRATQKQHKGDLPEKDSEILKNSNNNSWSRLKNKIDVIKNMRKSEPIDTGRIIDEKPEVVNEKCILEEEDEEVIPSFDPASLSRPTTFNISNSSFAIKRHNFADLSDKDDINVKRVIETRPVQPVAPAPGAPPAPRPPGAPPAPRPPGAPPAPPPPPGAPPAPRLPGAPPLPPAPRPPGAPPAPRPPGAPPAPRPPGAPPAPRPPGAAPRPPGAPPAPRPPGAPPAPRPPGAPRAPGAPPVPGSKSDGVSAMRKVANKKDLVKVFWSKVNLNKTTGLPPTIPGYAASKIESKSIWRERPEVKVDYDQLAVLFAKKKIETSKSLDTEKSTAAKFIRVLEGNRSRTVGLQLPHLPAARHIKQAILNMDTSHITREGISSLVKLVPSEEEKNQITEAKLANPDIPLAKEEEFVYTLSVIPNIRNRLNIWAFMIDFDALEDEVADYLMDLKECCSELKSCKTLHLIISYLLEIGNFLRQETSDGFELTFLSKVADIKDTVKKQTMVHHVACMMHQNHPTQGDLHREIGHTHRICRISFDEVGATLEKMDQLCDRSWEDLRIISKHTSSTNEIMQKQLTFLRSVAERINILKLVNKRVANRYYNLLLYFGIDPVKKFMVPDEFCRIISEFALEYRTAIEAVVLEQAKKKKMKGYGLRPKPLSRPDQR